MSKQPDVSFYHIPCATASVLENEVTGFLQAQLPEQYKTPEWTNMVPVYAGEKSTTFKIPYAIDYNTEDPLRYEIRNAKFDNGEESQQGGHGSVRKGSIQGPRSIHPSCDGYHAHRSLPIRGIPVPDVPLHSNTFSLLSRDLIEQQQDENEMLELENRLNNKQGNNGDINNNNNNINGNNQIHCINNNRSNNIPMVSIQPKPFNQEHSITPTHITHNELVTMVGEPAVGEFFTQRFTIGKNENSKPKMGGKKDNIQKSPPQQPKRSLKFKATTSSTKRHKNNNNDTNNNNNTSKNTNTSDSDTNSDDDEEEDEDDETLMKKKPAEWVKTPDIFPVDYDVPSAHIYLHTDFERFYNNNIHTLFTHTVKVNETVKKGTKAKHDQNLNATTKQHRDPYFSLLSFDDSINPDGDRSTVGGANTNNNQKGNKNQTNKGQKNTKNNNTKINQHPEKGKFSLYISDEDALLLQNHAYIEKIEQFQQDQRMIDRAAANTAGVGYKEYIASQKTCEIPSAPTTEIRAIAVPQMDFPPQPSHEPMKQVIPLVGPMGDENDIKKYKFEDKEEIIQTVSEQLTILVDYPLRLRQLDAYAFIDDETLPHSTTTVISVNHLANDQEFTSLLKHYDTNKEKEEYDAYKLRFPHHFDNEGKFIGTQYYEKLRLIKTTNNNTHSNEISTVPIDTPSLLYKQDNSVTNVNSDNNNNNNNNTSAQNNLINFAPTSTFSNLDDIDVINSINDYDDTFIPSAIKMEQSGNKNLQDASTKTITIPSQSKELQTSLEKIHSRLPHRPIAPLPTLWAPFLSYPPHRSSISITPPSTMYKSPYSMLYPYYHNYGTRGEPIAVKTALTNTNFVGLSFDHIREMIFLNHLSSRYRSDFCSNCLNKTLGIQNPMFVHETVKSKKLIELGILKQQREGGSNSPNSSGIAPIKSIHRTDYTTQRRNEQLGKMSKVAYTMPLPNDLLDQDDDLSLCEQADSALPFTNRPCLCSFHSITQGFELGRWEMHRQLRLHNSRFTVFPVVNTAHNAFNGESQTLREETRNLVDIEKQSTEMSDQIATIEKDLQNATNTANGTDPAIISPPQGGNLVSVFTNPSAFGDGYSSDIVKGYYTQIGRETTLPQHQWDLSDNTIMPYQISITDPDCDNLTYLPTQRQLSARLIRGAMNRRRVIDAKLYQRYQTQWDAIHGARMTRASPTDQLQFRFLTEHGLELHRQQVISSQLPLPFAFSGRFSREPFPLEQPQPWSYHDITQFDPYAKAYIEEFKMQDDAEYMRLYVEIYQNDYHTLGGFDSVINNTSGKINQTMDDIDVQDPKNSSHDNSTPSTSSSKPPSYPVDTWQNTSHRRNFVTKFAPYQQHAMDFLQLYLQGICFMDDENSSQHNSASDNKTLSSALQPYNNNNTGTITIGSKKINLITPFPNFISRMLGEQRTLSFEDQLSFTPSRRHRGKVYVFPSKFTQVPQLPQFYHKPLYPKPNIATKWLEYQSLRYIPLTTASQNPLVTQVYDSTAEGELMVMMEFMKTTLLDVIRYSYPNFTHYHIKRIFWMLCQSIAQFHRRFLLHRDIKPANVLVKWPTEPLGNRLEIHQRCKTHNSELLITQTAVDLGVPSHINPSHDDENGGLLGAISSNNQSDSLLLGRTIYDITDAQFQHNAAQASLDPSSKSTNSQKSDGSNLYSIHYSDGQYIYGYDPASAPSVIRGPYVNNLSERIDVYSHELEQRFSRLIQRPFQTSTLNQYGLNNSNTRPAPINAYPTIAKNAAHPPPLTDYELSTMVCSLADFGGAKDYGQIDKLLSAQAYTSWYRPPELLMFSRHYSYSADIWALGCLLGELMLGKPLFDARPRTEHVSFELEALQQLSIIFTILGPPDRKCWPGMQYLPGQPRNLEKLNGEHQQKMDLEAKRIENEQNALRHGNINDNENNSNSNNSNKMNDFDENNDKFQIEDEFDDYRGIPYPQPAYKVSAVLKKYNGTSALNQTPFDDDPRPAARLSGIEKIDFGLDSDTEDNNNTDAKLLDTITPLVQKEGKRVYGVNEVKPLSPINTSSRFTGRVNNNILNNFTAHFQPAKPRVKSLAYELTNKDLIHSNVQHGQNIGGHQLNPHVHQLQPNQQGGNNPIGPQHQRMQTNPRQAPPPQAAFPWVGLDKLFHYSPLASWEGINLVKTMLQWNPMERPNIEQVLQHSFFDEIRM